MIKRVLNQAQNKDIGILLHIYLNIDGNRQNIKQIIASSRYSKHSLGRFSFIISLFKLLAKIQQNFLWDFKMEFKLG